MLYTRPVFNRITHALHFGNKAYKTVSRSYRQLYIFVDQASDSWISGFSSEPFKIRLALAIGFNNRQMILPAEVIRKLTNFSIIGIKVVAEHSSVSIGHRVTNNMVMQMAFIKMC